MFPPMAARDLAGCTRKRQRGNLGTRVNSQESTTEPVSKKHKRETSVGKPAPGNPSLFFLLVKTVKHALCPAISNVFSKTG